MDTLRNVLNKIHGGDVLDVATGHGSFAGYLAEHLASYDSILGVDVAEDRIRMARDKAKAERVRFEVMDAGGLPHADASFDTVAISCSLHHLENIVDVLDEMKRVLKPGGLFIVYEPNRDNLNERQMTQALIHHWWAEVDQTRGVPHFETFTADEIRTIVERLGLSDVREVFDPGNADTCEPEVRKSFESHCIALLDALKDQPEQAALATKGRELLQRMDDVGMADGTALCLIGRK